MKHIALCGALAALLAALLAGCGARAAASARPADSHGPKSTPPDSMHATAAITEQYTLEKVVQAENGSTVRLNIHLPRLESDSADAARINAEIARLYEYDVQEYADSPAAADPAALPEASAPPSDQDSESFLIRDLRDGAVAAVPRREYLIGAVAAEMPITWPDEALKAQAIAAHSYALYCRDHASAANGSWLSADPARRQGYLTDAVLHSYWGTDYEANYARLSSLVDSVLGDVLCYDGAAAGTSYFAISNGRTEASENVWGSALPYLVPVDSSTDLSADNYEVTLTLSAPQVQQLLSSGLGIAANSAAPERWFGETTLTASGYAASLPVCGQTVSGTALRRALGLRSACFTIRYQDGSFLITTKGYGHGVGMSQAGANSMAADGADYRAILTHYYPGVAVEKR